MIDRGTVAEFLDRPDDMMLAGFPRLLNELSISESLDLLALLEDPDRFRDRLPLRLKLYALMAQFARDPALQTIALIRLLRRMGSRKDMPGLGDVPDQLPDFSQYMAQRVHELLGVTPLAETVGALADATRAFRSGDLNEMAKACDRGLKALSELESWDEPPINPGLTDLIVSEAGHELVFIAVNAAFRSGDLSRAHELAEYWSNAINRWEKVLGVLERQRYQFYRISGHIDQEVGLLDASVEAYNRALEYAPTAYTRAFLWISLARVERELGHAEDCWKHAIDAIRAWQESPYPQTAVSWIEWLAVDAGTPEKQLEIDTLRTRQNEVGGVEINRIVRAMTDLYRLLASLRSGADPIDLVPHLDRLIVEMEEAGSWPNLITILATRAVVLGRLEDREKMDESIERARELIRGKLAPDARPPVEFFVESAHALALRDVGEYEEAFHTLFERALEARKKYPGGLGPDEQSALEALYYLGALSGYDPDTIEKKIRSSLALTK
jgi:tetratricopeptide (TPR) repeat protein